MSNPPPTVLQLARQGDPEAIAALMNRHLEAQGITAHVMQHDSTLQVNLEAAQIPNQADLVAYVKKGITGLELAAIQQLTVSGKQLGADTSAWSEDLVLQDSSVGDLDFDLGLEAVPVSDDLDLGFDLDSTSGDLDLDQLGDFDAALGNDFGGADLDLGFTDSPSDLNLDAPDDFDLSFTDDSASDLGLDPTDTSLTDSGTNPGAADDFALEFTDTSADASDLDFDLGLGADPSDSGVADLDFDLGLSEPAATEPAADFDLDLALADTPAADLSFTEDSESATSDAALDFDLGLDDAAAGAADDLGFDLDLTDEPAEGTPASDFDLDLSMGDLDMDDEFAGASEDDLNLGSELSPIAAADTDLDFDFDREEPNAPNGLDADALDLDLGLEDAPTGASDGFDFALGTDDNALDLDFAAADEAALLDLEADQWPAASDPEAVANFDFDFETDPELTENVGDGEAIAADLDFDLNAPAAPPTAPDVDGDLDDLWSSGDASLDLESIPSPGPADGTTDPWATDLSGLDDLVGFDEGLSDEAGLSEELTNLEDSPSDLDLPEVELDSLGVAEFDAELGLGFDDEELDPEAPMGEEITPDTDAFPDLDLTTGYATPDLEPGLENLAPELLASEALAFEDLGAAADLDLTEAAALGSDDWASVEPDLTVDADSDLGTYDDLGAYDDLGSADFAAADLDLAEDEPNVEATDTSVPSDFELEAASEDLLLEPLGADTFISGESDSGFSEAEAPPWAAEDSSFDPNLVLDSPADFEVEPEIAFDPGLSFDPQAETPYSTPNPFDAEAYGTGFDADTDMPFSTMELDQTVEGDFIPDLAMAGEPGEPGDVDDTFLGQPEDYSAGAAPASALGLSDDIMDDPAFESVEFGSDELDAPGFEAAGLSDEGFEIQDFGDEGFEDEGFDAGGFSDSSLDSNGFIQDRNGVALVDDEPDATDDFIQEFGSDPSTHVSLSPEQFNDDGSVRRSVGGSGLPMRLIVGLGLGALALALLGLLLNGLLGRLRPPTPGGDPVVTEPAVPPPVDPAAVPAEDLFRQAVNAAQTAANQAQTATTPAQWQEVANAWAQAIDLMQRVPASDPNYATAQQKAVDYQPNLDYARQNAQ